jgi:hypothetical protein
MRRILAVVRLYQSLKTRMGASITAIQAHPVAFWNRSTHWEWYTGLFLGGVGLIAVNEASVGLFLILLSAISLASRLWHSQRRTLTKLFGTTGIFLLFLFASIGTVAYMEERPWSNVPVFFKRFVFLTVIPKHKIPISLRTPTYPPSLELFVATAVPLPPPAPPAPPKPDIGMEFVNPDDVAFRMVNLSKAVVRDPKYGFVLMDLDGHKTTYSNGETLPDILPIPARVLAGDFLKGKQKYLPRAIVSTFPSVKNLVKLHDRVFGTVGVSCPDCIKDRRYVLFFKYGEGGWYCEYFGVEGNQMIPIRSEKDLEKIAPSRNRIPIKPVS